MTFTNAQRRRRLLMLVVVLPALVAVQTTSAGGFDPVGPGDASLVVTLEPVFTDLDEPLFVTNAADGSNRLFVVDRHGYVYVGINGQLLDQPFLDINSLVQSADLEQGLLGLAFPPDYELSGVLYVYYTANDGANTLARYHVTADPNVADSANGDPLFSIPDRAENHNGGMLAFGPDGYLYVAMGDEGGANNEYGNAQKLDNLFGKILRLDVSGDGDYAIPPDNPFVSDTAARPETWLWGLRNPWRFTFDRLTGDMWIGDVGQGRWEEINFLPSGASGGNNFGWNITEGTHCTDNDTCDTSGLTLPIVDYSHDYGCSTTGGYVYRGAAEPMLFGRYLFGDFCSGRIWSLAETDGGWAMTELLDTEMWISSFGEDEAGELYVTDLTGNAVYRISVTDAFERTWARTDQPVIDLAAERTWMWGPEPLYPALTEEYADAPGVSRTVVYFDKSRMEVTQPAADENATWYVTNGLLAKEMITGRRQVGDDEFDQRDPARINVAGDPDDPDGPTYSDLGQLLDASPLADGAPVIQRLDANGAVTDDPTLVDEGVTAAHHVQIPGIDHQVASPFWQFMNSTAPVYVDGVLVDAPLFENPFYATGYPITEAYWATVRVAGTPRDVLMQCFERRCLTYTPENDPGWRVEAGNVGQHYYRWRYVPGED